jgi:RecA-family ATPase
MKAKPRDANNILREEGEDALRAHIDKAARRTPGTIERFAPKGNHRADDLLPETNVTAWHGKPVPERDWIVHNRIIRRNVALLSGPGGIGKSILIKQLGVAHVLGRDWLGTMPVQGPVIYLNCEDDERELHYRFHAVLDHYGAGFDALGDFHLTALAGKDAVLGETSHQGIVKPTRLFDLLYKRACAIRPILVAIDTAADVFAGNENDRAQVRQFIGLLRRIAIDASCAVLLASHPSVSGMDRGDGLSGSTAWHNSVRTRLYFQSAHKPNDGGNDGLRELRCMKSNYGPDGEVVRLRFDNGVFKPIAEPSSVERMAQEKKTEALFLDLLDRLNRQGQRVSPHPSSPQNYAPKFFAKHGDTNGTGQKALETAMQRLLNAGTIRIVQEGPPSRSIARLVRS